MRAVRVLACECELAIDAIGFRARRSDCSRSLFFLQILKEVRRPARRRNLSIHSSPPLSICFCRFGSSFLPRFFVARLVPMLLCLISLCRGLLREVMLRLRVFEVACADPSMRPIRTRPLVFRFCLIQCMRRSIACCNSFRFAASPTLYLWSILSSSRSWFCLTHEYCIAIFVRLFQFYVGIASEFRMGKK